MSSSFQNHFKVSVCVLANMSSSFEMMNSCFRMLTRTHTHTYMYAHVSIDITYTHTHTYMYAHVSIDISYWYQQAAQGSQQVWKMHAFVRIHTCTSMHTHINLYILASCGIREDGRIHRIVYLHTHAYIYVHIHLQEFAQTVEYISKCTICRTKESESRYCGVATMSRRLTITVLFCKRAL